MYVRIFFIFLFTYSVTFCLIRNLVTVGMASNLRCSWFSAVNNCCVLSLDLIFVGSLIFSLFRVVLIFWCLEDKREDYQNCSVLYCVPQLYPVIYTLIGYEKFLQVNCWFRFSFILCVFLVFSQLGPVYHRVSWFCILFGCCLVVRTSTIDWLERLIPGMSYYVLNSTHYSLEG